MKVLSIVGYSGSGKTHFIERLVRTLTDKGYRVVTVKHDVHGFEIDRPGKDSYRHRMAGARQVVISSPRRFALIAEVEEEMAVEDIIDRFCRDADIVITEGYKRGPYPKIELHRKEAGKPLTCVDDKNLVAIFADRCIDVDVPVYPIDDVEKAVELVEGMMDKEEHERLVLWVNGRRVSLKPFIEKFLRESIKGMISSLKGCEDARGIEISIGRD